MLLVRRPEQRFVTETRAQAREVGGVNVSCSRGPPENCMTSANNRANALALHWPKLSPNDRTSLPGELTLASHTPSPV